MHASRVLLSHTAYIHRAAHQQTKAYSDSGFYTGEILELLPGKESGQLFQDAINEAKKSQGLVGDCVYTYSVEEYAEMRLFLTPDGMAGVALKPDGDMVSVFKNKNLKDTEESRISSLLTLAISQGAIKADCYGIQLEYATLFP